jgi:hypothetical protein
MGLGTVFSAAWSSRRNRIPRQGTGLLGSRLISGLANSAINLAHKAVRFSSPIPLSTNRRNHERVVVELKDFRRGWTPISHHPPPRNQIHCAGASPGHAGYDWVLASDDWCSTWGEFLVDISLPSRHRGLRTCAAQRSVRDPTLGSHSPLPYRALGVIGFGARGWRIALLQWELRRVTMVVPPPTGLGREKLWAPSISGLRAQIRNIILLW